MWARLKNILCDEFLVSMILVKDKYEHEKWCCDRSDDLLNYLEGWWCVLFHVFFSVFCVHMYFISFDKLQDIFFYHLYFYKLYFFHNQMPFHRMIVTWPEGGWMSNCLFHLKACPLRFLLLSFCLLKFYFSRIGYLTDGPE